MSTVRNSEFYQYISKGFSSYLRTVIVLLYQVALEVGYHQCNMKGPKCQRPYLAATKRANSRQRLIYVFYLHTFEHFILNIKTDTSLCCLQIIVLKIIILFQKRIFKLLQSFDTRYKHFECPEVYTIQATPE